MVRSALVDGILLSKLELIWISLVELKSARMEAKEKKC